jgi:hypothetical protein
MFDAVLDSLRAGLRMGASGSGSRTQGAGERLGRADAW